MRKGTVDWIVLAAILLQTEIPAIASGHGPIFGMATPTNGKGLWSLDWGAMARGGEDGPGVMTRGQLSYGITENLMASISAPLTLRKQPLAPAFMSTDALGYLTWRFHRQDTGIGSRFESAVIGGVVVPGAQSKGMLQAIGRSPGVLTGIVTGYASRSNYAWAGINYLHYAESGGGRRPDLFSYSLVYGYRPHSWRTDYPRWDWRLFGELSGERAGPVQLHSMKLPHTEAHQIFVGPSTLGVYKNYAVSAGVQFPIYRANSPFYPEERFRVAINVTYYFSREENHQ